MAQVSQAEQERNKSKLLRGLERAKQIIPTTPVANKNPLKESSGYDIDEPIIGLTSSSYDSYEEPNYSMIGGMSESAFKLPPEILESMIGTPIGDSTSILDELPIAKEKPIKPTPSHSPQRAIREQTYSQPVQQMPVVQQTIDYSLIKTIIEDVVKKNNAALKKSILTESKNMVDSSNLNIMKIGDKFQFLTDDGNLFEATLTFKKNIKNKGTR